MILPTATSLAVQAGSWAALTHEGELLSGQLPNVADLPKDAPCLLYTSDAADE